MPSKHSTVVGGSTAARLLGCPGSSSLVNTLPPSPGSDFAAEGTMLHSAMEKILLSDGLVPADLIGFRDPDVPKHEVTIDHVGDALVPALDAFNDYADHFKIDKFECEAVADWESEVPGAFGSVDVLGTGPEYNMVLDWKFGRGVQLSATNNKQLMFYAAGAMLAGAECFNPDLPTALVIVQPRVTDGNSVSVVDTPQLLAFVLSVKAALLASRQPNPEFAKGSWCKFCPAAHCCPAQRQQAMDLHSKLEPLIRQKTMDTKQIAELLPIAEQVEDWVKELRGAAHCALEAGQPVDGYKLVAKRGTRKWNDEAAIRGRLKQLRLPLKDTDNRGLKSPAQLEKMLKQKGKKVDLEQYCSSVSTGSTIARDDDRRPALQRTFGRQLTLTDHKHEGLIA